MGSNDSLRTAFMAAIAELEAAITGDEHAGVVARVREAGLDLLDEHAITEGVLEARDEQIAAQVDLLANVELPFLQVRKGTLCVPLIGDFDGVRTSQLVQGLLEQAVARRTTTVVIDLTGALFRDIVTVSELARVFQALRLIGVRGLLSGVGAGLAPWLAEMHGSLRDVPCFADLAEALAADEPRGRT